MFPRPRPRAWRYQQRRRTAWGGWQRRSASRSRTRWSSHGCGANLPAVVAPLTWSLIEDFEDQVVPFVTDEQRQEYDTLGGLVFALADRVPTRGDVLKHESGVRFEVLEADPRRVRRLRSRAAAWAEMASAIRNRSSLWRASSCSSNCCSLTT